MIAQVSFARNTNNNIIPGNFVDIDGNVIGQHKGITNYTVGQRKGLNLAMGYPVFVIEIRPESNEVVIGKSTDVLKTTLIADNVNYMADEEVDENKEYIAKIRYNHRGTKCHVKKNGNNIECIFEEPVRAVDSRTAVVVYDGEYVAFGGTILRGID